MANESPVSTIDLVGLQGQLNGVRSELVASNSNLQGISNLIQADNARDQEKLSDEKKQQQLLLERQIRTGQEEQIEQKVSSAFEEPAKKVEQNLNSTFNNIDNSLRGSFFGAIGPVFLAGLTKAVNLGRGAFSKVGASLKAVLGGVGGALGSIRNGFGSIIGSIGEIVSNIIKSPFKSIGNLFNKLLGRGEASATAGAAAATAEAAGATTAATTEAAATSTAATASSLGGFNPESFLKGGARVLSGVNAFNSAQQGDTLGASIYGASTLFPNLFTGAASLGYTFREPLMKALGNIGNGLNLPNLLGSFSGLSGLFQSDQGDKTTQSDAQQTVNIPSTEIPANASISPAASSTQTTTTISAQQTALQPPPPEARNLNPPSEPTPDVVYVQSGSQQGATVTPAQSAPLTDVPLISSSNPDNFYTLYAQLNYNVVI